MTTPARGAYSTEGVFAVPDPVTSFPALAETFHSQKANLWKECNDYIWRATPADHANWSGQSTCP